MLVEACNVLVRAIEGVSARVAGVVALTEVEGDNDCTAEKSENHLLDSQNIDLTKIE